MRAIVRRLLLGIAMTLVIAAVCASAPVTGVVEGQIRVLSEKGTSLDGVSRKDEKPACENCAVVILGKSDRNEIAQATTDNEGRFRVGLPAGDYVLELKRDARVRLRGTPKTFTIKAQQTVHVEMDVEMTVSPM